ncbi:MAG: hypothetical protein DAHOPDDO_02484 [Ignavibacteriaceae bacterium]|nr:hypothetical protein [Ignavibacteriaceae bacterium]
MMEIKNLFDLCENSNLIPQHKCKQNLQVIEETHSVNSLHNIVIARIQQCKICGKKFEQYDPNGLDKIF